MDDSKQIGRLVLTMREGESVLTSNGIAVHIAEMKDKTVRLLFIAPKDIKIIREEVIRKGGKFGNSTSAKSYR